MNVCVGLRVVFPLDNEIVQLNCPGYRVGIVTVFFEAPRKVDRVIDGFFFKRQNPSDKGFRNRCHVKCGICESLNTS
jgi:hypothetical protein